MEIATSLLQAGYQLVTKFKRRCSASPPNEEKLKTGFWGNFAYIIESKHVFRLLIESLFPLSIIYYRFLPWRPAG